MHQNDAEAMQQNATQLNSILISWNRITIATISCIISKHSTHSNSPQPHYLLSHPPNKSRKHKSQVFFNPATPSWITASKISQPPQVRSYAFWSSLNTSGRLHLKFTYNLHLQHHSNRRCIWNPVGHLLWSSSAEILNVLRLQAIFAEELYRGYSTGLSLQLYPIT